MRGWFRRLAQGVAGAIGGAIGGPIGAIIVVALFELAWPEDGGGMNGLKGGGTFPTHLQNQLNEWIEKAGERITFRLFATELNNKSKQELVGEYCVNAVNVALRQLSALKAYVQWENMNVTPGSDTDKLNKAKLHGLDFVINGIIQAYTEATQGVTSVFKYSEKSFRASDFDKIELLNLNWQGQTITATAPGYHRAGGGFATESARNTSKGGTGSGTGKSGTVPSEEKPGNTTTTVVTTTTTSGTTTQAGTTPDATAPKKNWKYTGALIGIAAGLLFAHLTKKSNKNAKRSKS